MPAAEVEAWLQSKKAMVINHIQLQPRAHPHLPGSPLSASRGQAEAFFAVDSQKSVWIIKKFHQGKAPDAAYLNAISGILPSEPAFRAGRERRVITASDIDRACPPDCARWLEGTVLMPRIDGVDWATFADELRGDPRGLSREARALLCRNLTRAISSLEAVGCSHRDLSSSNVFIERATLGIALIDWDSAYHPHLTMPPNTTVGSDGYIAPFVSGPSGPDVSLTWVPCADRFAMAALCAEFLTVGLGSPLAGDGGIFTQRDLDACFGPNARPGPSVAAALKNLAQDYPAAYTLFERALNARSFADCPTPTAWEAFTDSILGRDVTPPTLDSIPWPDDDAILNILTLRQPPPPVWPVPSLNSLGDPDMSAVLANRAQTVPQWAPPRLDDMPEVSLSMPKQSAAPQRTAPSLPDDPFFVRKKP